MVQSWHHGPTVETYKLRTGIWQGSTHRQAQNGHVMGNIVKETIPNLSNVRVGENRWTCHQIIGLGAQVNGPH